MKFVFSLLLYMFVLLVVPALAIDLQTAKERGLVGEMPTGYLGSVVEPGPEIKELVDDINARRKARYQEIAAKNGISLDKVEKLAGEKAIEKTLRGQYVKIGGDWRKK